MSWLLAQARIPGRADFVDLLVRDGRLRLLPPGQPAPADCQFWNLEGRVVLPGLVELHAHIDKTYTDSRNPEGTLAGAIERFAAATADRTLDQIEARAERALRAAIAHGVTRLRTHLVFGSPRDLAVLEVMVGLRRRYAPCIELQFVAMTWDVRQPERVRLLEQGVSMGIDLLGGAPSLSADPRAGVTDLVALARRLQLGLDLHVDEHDTPGSTALEVLVEQVEPQSIRGRVTASHCCSLAFMPPAQRDRLLQAAAAREIALVVLPACNLVLQGRGQWPVPRGSAPVAAAHAAGMLVAAGVDNVQDPFNPFGDYDPLQSARLAALVGHLATDGDFGRVLDLVTTDAAAIFGGAPACIADGAPADLVITDCRDLNEVIAHPPPRLATFKKGLPVVRTRIEQDWITG